MVDITELPVEVIAYIVKLRKESANHRMQRNDARAELEKAQGQLDHLSGFMDALDKESSREDFAPGGVLRRATDRNMQRYSGQGAK